MIKLYCTIVGVPGSVFAVDIDEGASVFALKNEIKTKNPVTIKCEADLLELFLAKKKNSVWLTEEDVENGVKDTDGLKPLKSAQSKICDSVLLEVALRPDVTKEDVAALKGYMDVVVVIPEVVREDRVWTEKDLATIDPEIQAKTWKSVVRISSKDIPACSGTALVVDRTPTHLYLLANLHLWDDATLTKHLSAAFNMELTGYRSVHPKMELSRKKRRSDEFVKQPRRGPQVVVEQHIATSSTSTLTEVLRFSLHPSVCWRSSAEFDYAIFKIPAADDIELIRCEFSMVLCNTISVHAFGFPGILYRRRTGPSDAIISAQVTGCSRNRMSLSAHCVSGSVVVCSKRGSTSVAYRRVFKRMPSPFKDYRSTCRAVAESKTKNNFYISKRYNSTGCFPQ